MPEEYELTKYQLWGLGLLRGFFGALHDGQLPSFLKSDELASFMRQIREGDPFGGKTPDFGRPGSELPGGGMDPLDVARDLFRSLSFGLTDRSGGVDPATRPDDQDELHMTRNSDGSLETFYIDDDDRYSWKREDAKGNVETTTMTPDPTGGGFTVEEHYYSRDGDRKRTMHYDGAPGDDGGDANSDRNPLTGMNVIGPQSNEQAISALQHPGKDPDELDPNSGISAFSLTEAEQERLGRIVPGLEVLDPNSGMDPLSQLNLDPNQLHTRSEEDDRIDPNTGVGGGSFGSLFTNTDTKTNNDN